MSVWKKLVAAMDRTDAIASMCPGQVWYPKDQWEGRTLHGITLGGFPVKIIRETAHGYILGPSIPDVTGWTEQAPATTPPPVDPMDVTWPGEKVKVFPAKVRGWRRETGAVDIEVDPEDFAGLLPVLFGSSGYMQPRRVQADASCDSLDASSTP